MFKIFTQQKKQFDGKRTLLIIAIVLAATVLFTSFLPADASSFGVFSLVPAIFLVIYIFATIREKLEIADVPESFKGVPIALITVGIMACAIAGIAGLV